MTALVHLDLGPGLDFEIRRNALYDQAVLALEFRAGDHRERLIVALRSGRLQAKTFVSLLKEMGGAGQSRRPADLLYDAALALDRGARSERAVSHQRFPDLLPGQRPLRDPVSGQAADLVAE